MPREYIARLVFDRFVSDVSYGRDGNRNHASMAIVKKNLRVVGGITYRLFNDRKFAEIVFCAITATEQVRVRFFSTPAIELEQLGLRIAFDEPPERLHP